MDLVCASDDHGPAGPPPERPWDWSEGAMGPPRAPAVGTPPDMTHPCDPGRGHRPLSTVGCGWFYSVASLVRHPGESVVLTWGETRALDSLRRVRAAVRGRQSIPSPLPLADRCGVTLVATDDHPSRALPDDPTPARPALCTTGTPTGMSSGHRPRIPPTCHLSRCPERGCPEKKYVEVKGVRDSCVIRRINLDAAVCVVCW